MRKRRVRAMPRYVRLLWKLNNDLDASVCRCPSSFLLSSVSFLSLSLHSRSSCGTLWREPLTFSPSCTLPLPSAYSSLLLPLSLSPCLYLDLSLSLSLSLSRLSLSLSLSLSFLLPPLSLSLFSHSLSYMQATFFFIFAHFNFPKNSLPLQVVKWQYLQFVFQVLANILWPQAYMCLWTFLTL